MTDRIAFFLALIILAVFAVDLVWLQNDLPVFLGRKVMALIDLVAFWR